MAHQYRPPHPAPRRNPSQRRHRPTPPGATGHPAELLGRRPTRRTHRLLPRHHRHTHPPPTRRLPTQHHRTRMPRHSHRRGHGGPTVTDGFRYAEASTLLGRLQPGCGAGARRHWPGPERIRIRWRDPRSALGCPDRVCRRRRNFADADNRVTGRVPRGPDSPARVAARSGWSWRCRCRLMELDQLDAVMLLRRYLLEGVRWEAGLETVWDWEAPRSAGRRGHSRCSVSCR